MTRCCNFFGVNGIENYKNAKRPTENRGLSNALFLKII